MQVVQVEVQESITSYSNANLHKDRRLQGGRLEKHGTFNKQETSRTESGVAELYQFAQTPTITKSTNGLMAMRSRPYEWRYQNKKVNLGLKFIKFADSQNFSRTFLQIS